MEKVILHPGNGINIPVKGDYVKLNLKLTDANGKTLFDSSQSQKKYADVRYKTTEANMFDQLEELIGEMSLFEKCSLEIDKSYLPNITSKQIKMLLEQYQKIIFYVEIVDISKTPHLN